MVQLVWQPSPASGACFQPTGGPLVPMRPRAIPRLSEFAPAAIWVRFAQSPFARPSLATLWALLRQCLPVGLAFTNTQDRADDGGSMGQRNEGLPIHKSAQEVWARCVEVDASIPVQPCKRSLVNEGQHVCWPTFAA